MRAAGRRLRLTVCLSKCCSSQGCVANPGVPSWLPLLSLGWPPQAMDSLMPGFDKEIAKLAQRVLINPRKIDYHTGVLATKVTPGAAPWAVKLLFRLAL